MAPPPQIRVHMGYFTAAFLFNEEPDWEPLRPLGFRLALTGYRHISQPLRLLACRDASEKKGWEYPFAHFIEPPPYRRADLAEQADEKALIESVALAAGVVADNSYHQAYAASAIALGLDVHGKTRRHAFFLAADDEGLDIAFELREDRLARFRMAGNCGVATFDGAHISVEPQVVVDGDDEYGSQPGALQRAAQHPLIQLRETRRVTEEELEVESEAGNYCRGAIELWPPGWPDPKAAFDLGGLNMWSSFPADFKLVFRMDRHAKPPVV